MAAYIEKAKKIRGLIELWVNATLSPGNLRGQALLSPSSLVDGRVFDDYTAGLKVYMTYVVPEDPFKRPENYVMDLNRPVPATVRRTRSKDSLLLDRNTVITSHELTQELYDKIYRPAINRITRSAEYRRFFKDGLKSVANTERYLRNFYPFTDIDFTENRHSFPYAELFKVETHISLLFYYAKYFEERAKFETLEISESKKDHDSIGVKEIQAKTRQAMKECKSLLENVFDGYDNFGRQLQSASGHFQRQLMYMYHELSVNHSNLSMYKQTENICEAYLVARIANDLLSLRLYEDEYPGLPSAHRIRQEIEERFAFASDESVMPVADYFLTAYPINTSKDYIESFSEYSYSLPKKSKSKQEYIFGHKEISSIKSLNALLSGWLKHSPAKEKITEDVIKKRIETLMDKKKKPHQWHVL
jgi:hypothetical protein